MTSKIIVNQIEGDVGVSSVTFNDTIYGNLEGNVTGNVTSGTLTGITSVSTTNLTVNGNAYPSFGALSHRNYVINGAFNQWERGTSFTANSAVTFGADRFAAYSASSGANAYTRSTDVPTNQGFTYSGSFDGVDIRHSIELPGNALRGQFIDGSQWTLSFWVKAGSSGTGTVNAGWGDGVAASQLTNWGADKNYTYSTSWEKKEITFTVGNNLVAGDVAILLYWSAVAGQKITGVQFEKGTVASPFEFLHPADELLRCQRYYVNTNWVFCTSISGLNYRKINPGPGVRMRTSPVHRYTHPTTGVVNNAYEHSSANTLTIDDASNASSPGPQGSTYFGLDATPSYDALVRIEYDAEL